MHRPNIIKRIMVIKGPRKSRNKVMLGRACFALLKMYPARLGCWISAREVAFSSSLSALYLIRPRKERAN